MPDLPGEVDPATISPEEVLLLKKIHTRARHLIESLPTLLEYFGQMLWRRCGHTNESDPPDFRDLFEIGLIVQNLAGGIEKAIILEQGARYKLSKMGITAF